MKAFIVDRYGSDDRVRCSEVPDPEMREDDALIQIHTAGVNPLDSKIRNGEFKLLLPYRLQLILANECAVRPGLDRVFPFESTKEAMAYLETGRAKGKVVVRVR